jgi:transcriptional regulator with XRE-family HTH domain
MIEFGKELKAAREAKGLTCSQVAEKTHLMTQVVEGLEAEDFKKIVAPIYGRGFVKLYCEAVGLDAKPYIDEFMRLYSLGKTPQERAPFTNVEIPPRVEEPIPAPQPTVPEPPPPAPKAEPVAAELPLEGLLPSQPTMVHSKIPTPVESEQTPPPPPPPPPRKTAAPKVSRYSDPLFDPPPFEEPQPTSKPKRAFHLPTMDVPSVPPSLWRIAALVVVAILIIWGLVVGVKALYRATMTAPEPEKTAAVQVEKKPVAPTAKPAATPAAKGPRKPMNIPALYID